MGGGVPHEYATELATNAVNAALNAHLMLDFILAPLSCSHTQSQRRQYEWWFGGSSCSLV
jgi:hypothetical protein